MSTRARIAARGALLGLAALPVIWFAAFHLGGVARVDASVLRGFAGLHRPRVDAVATFVAGLCNPRHYVLLALVPVVLAVIRGRRRLAVLVAVLMPTASVITEVLKPLLHSAHPVRVPGIAVSAASWPSGHATAAMTLALCAVLVAPRRARPAVGALMAAFTIAVCYSFLELGWHYPSDVIGGFLVATVTVLTGVAALETYDARRARSRTAPEARAPTAAVAPAGSRLTGVRASLAAALRPALVLAALIAVAGAAAVAVRPHPLLSYAREHPVFLLGAAAIALCGVLLAAALVAGLDRAPAAATGSGPAARGAPPPRWRRGSG